MTVEEEESLHVLVMFVVTVLAELLTDRTRYTFFEWRNSTNTGEREKKPPKRFVKVESFF
jgi:hypothetical protein